MYIYQATINNIVVKKTTQLVLLFHKKTSKLVFLWPNMGQKCLKVLTSFHSRCLPLIKYDIRYFKMNSYDYFILF